MAYCTGGWKGFPTERLHLVNMTRPQQVVLPGQFRCYGLIGYDVQMAEERQKMVYRAAREKGGSYGIYAVGLGPPFGAVPLTRTVTEDGGEAFSFDLIGAGPQVMYIGRPNPYYENLAEGTASIGRRATSGGSNLYLTSLDTPDDDLRINPEGTNVLSADAFPEKELLLYAVEQLGEGGRKTLYVASLDSPTEPKAIGHPVGVDYYLYVMAPTEGRVAFLERNERSEKRVIRVVDLDAIGQSQMIERPQGTVRIGDRSRGMDLGFSADGRYLYYLANKADGSEALYATAVTAPERAIELEGSLSPEKYFGYASPASDFVPVPGGRGVTYLVRSRRTGDVLSIRAAGVDLKGGSTVLARSEQGVLGEGYEMTSGGKHLLYFLRKYGKDDAFLRRELHMVGLRSGGSAASEDRSSSGASASVNLSGTRDVVGFALSPDDRHITYVALEGAAGTKPEAGPQANLYVSSLEPGSDPVRLNGKEGVSMETSPQWVKGGWVIYAGAQGRTLYAVRRDRPGKPMQIGDPLPQGSGTLRSYTVLEPSMATEEAASGQQSVGE